MMKNRVIKRSHRVKRSAMCGFCQRSRRPIPEIQDLIPFPLAQIDLPAGMIKLSNVTNIFSHLKQFDAFQPSPSHPTYGK